MPECKHPARFLLPRLAAALLCAVAPLAAGCGLAAQGRNVDGVRYFLQGNYQLALTRFQEAQRTDPQNADSYYNLAATYHKIGLQNRDVNSLSQAENFYNTCLNYNPNHTDCYRGLAVLLTETGRTERAFTLLSNWARTSPQSADARVELARLSEEMGDNANAEKYLTEALRIDAGNWRALAALGRQREMQGRYQEAIANYQRAQQLNPHQPQLASKVAELSARVAQGGLPPSAMPGGTSTAGNGFGWTNPPGSAPANIIASPVGARLGTVTTPAPRQY